MPLGFWSLFLDPHRIQQAAVIIRPSTLSRFQNLPRQRTYRLLCSAGRKRKPGPKRPSCELIQTIVAIKQRNPRFGCPRIAQRSNKALGVEIDKDRVRHVVANPHPSPASRMLVGFAAAPTPDWSESGSHLSFE
jgi:hypothetical protein